jgi:aryl-alcohol dehydrogenase (NADP+)
MTYGSKKWREWVLEEADSKPFFKAAFDAGINFLDTADVYSQGMSEEITGRAVKEFARRDEVVIATKVFNPMGKGPNQKGLSRKHIMEAVDASLKRLGTDYIDLYIIHRLDPETSMEEMIEALSDVVRAGKVLYLGASSMRAWQFSKLVTMQRERGLAPFVSMQNYYNLVYREEEREVNPLCVEEGLGLIPWSPLARGFLIGNRRPTGGGSTTRSNDDNFADHLYYKQSDFRVVDAVSALAKRREVTNAQVALAWLLHQPGVTAPIVGATKIEHLIDAVKALELKLDADELKALTTDYEPHPVLGHI